MKRGKSVLVLILISLMFVSCLNFVIAEVGQDSEKPMTASEFTSLVAKEPRVGVSPAKNLVDPFFKMLIEDQIIVFAVLMDKSNVAFLINDKLKNLIWQTKVDKKEGEAFLNSIAKKLDPENAKKINFKVDVDVMKRLKWNGNKFGILDENGKFVAGVDFKDLRPSLKEIKIVTNKEGDTGLKLTFARLGVTKEIDLYEGSVSKDGYHKDRNGELVKIGGKPLNLMKGYGKERPDYGKIVITKISDEMHYQMSKGAILVTTYPDGKTAQVFKQFFSKGGLTGENQKSDDWITSYNKNHPGDFVEDEDGLVVLGSKGTPILKNIRYQSYGANTEGNYEYLVGYDSSRRVPTALLYNSEVTLDDFIDMSYIQIKEQGGVMNINTKLMENDMGAYGLIHLLNPKTRVNSLVVDNVGGESGGRRKSLYVMDGRVRLEFGQNANGETRVMSTRNAYYARVGIGKIDYVQDNKKWQLLADSRGRYRFTTFDSNQPQPLSSGSVEMSSGSAVAGTRSSGSEELVPPRPRGQRVIRGVDKKGGVSLVSLGDNDWVDSRGKDYNSVRNFFLNDPSSKAELEGSGLAIIKMGFKGCPGCDLMDTRMVTAKGTGVNKVFFGSIDVNSAAGRKIYSGSVPRVLVVQNGKVVHDGIGAISQTQIQNYVRGYTRNRASSVQYQSSGENKNVPTFNWWQNRRTESPKEPVSTGPGLIKSLVPVGVSTEESCLSGCKESGCETGCR